MARTISIGAQGYEYLRTNGDFYVDKTGPTALLPALRRGAVKDAVAGVA